MSVWWTPGLTHAPSHISALAPGWLAACLTPSAVLSLQPPVSLLLLLLLLLPFPHACRLTFPLALPNPLAGGALSGPVGYVETQYLDDALRISSGDKGSLFIAVRGE